MGLEGVEELHNQPMILRGICAMCGCGLWKSRLSEPCLDELKHREHLLVLADGRSERLDPQPSDASGDLTLPPCLSIIESLSEQPPSKFFHIVQRLPLPSIPVTRNRLRAPGFRPSNTPSVRHSK